ncbi:gamma carbonic anhydrase family protein [bacterium]|mgnify:FL=1|nr:gamma carbonic anhydrase family protein [Flavobacteriales bacterium]MDA9019308.1 gamma carbonic anhydrase family protein [Flavobacteriales bacterium]MDC3198365.1 gamma carbonic anhydrase family protein [bacterium]
MIQSFQGMVPVVHETAYVHPLASVIGHVSIGANCFIGAGAVLRGDWGKIILEKGCNVQENAVIHMFPNTTVTLHEGAHIGHGAMVHGATIGEQCMIGMNAVVLDDVQLGKESIVGALTLVKAQSVWEARSLIVGNPGKCIGSVSDEMIAHKIEGTALYQRLPGEMHASSRVVEPLNVEPENRIAQFPTFETWQARRKNK